MLLENSLIKQIPSFLGLYPAEKKHPSWLDKYPLIDKIALIFNFIIRTVEKVALMAFLPFSPVVNGLIGLAGGLYYLKTIEERSCQYRFAIPSLLGAVAFQISRPGLAAMISGVAFKSLAAFAIASAAVLPLVVYFVGVVILSNYAINEKHKNAQSMQGHTCCSEVK